GIDLANPRRMRTGEPANLRIAGRRGEAGGIVQALQIIGEPAKGVELGAAPSAPGKMGGHLRVGVFAGPHGIEIDQAKMAVGIAHSPIQRASRRKGSSAARRTGWVALSCRPRRMTIPSVGETHATAPFKLAAGDLSVDPGAVLAAQGAAVAADPRAVG